MADLNSASFATCGAVAFVTPDMSREVQRAALWIDLNMPKFGPIVVRHIQAREYISPTPEWAARLFAQTVIEEVARVLTHGYRPTEYTGVMELIGDSIENVADRLGLPVSACIETWQETGTDADGVKQMTVRDVKPLLRQHYADISAELPASIDSRIVVTYKAGR